jgi:prolyl-tRNA synthetase
MKKKSGIMKSWLDAMPLFLLDDLLKGIEKGFCRNILSNFASVQLMVSPFLKIFSHLLTEIQTDMFTKAKKELDENVVIANEWKDVVKALDQSKLFMAPFCGIDECEDDIKELSKADVEVCNSYLFW